MSPRLTTYRFVSQARPGNEFSAAKRASAVSSRLTGPPSTGELGTTSKPMSCACKAGDAPNGSGRRRIDRHALGNLLSNLGTNAQYLSGGYEHMTRIFRIHNFAACAGLAFLLFLIASSPILAQTPTLTLLSPSSATAGSPGFTLNLTGTNFNAASQVQWNGGARPTGFISATQLTAAIPASDIAAPGVAQVTVFNPTTALTSNPLQFTILAPGPPPSSPPPTLNSVGPAIAAQGSQHLQLTLRGANFRPGASVVISPPLASVQLSQANQPATDIMVENVSQLSSSLMMVVISVSPRAAPGLRAVDVVNTDATNTGAQPALGSATSKQLNLALSNSLAAPLGIQTIAITQPRDGLVIAQGDDFFAQ